MLCFGAAAPREENTLLLQFKVELERQRIKQEKELTAFAQKRRLKIEVF